MKQWYKSVFTSGALTFLGTFSFARVGDATLEHAIYLSIAMACIAITIHRFALLIAEDLEKTYPNH